MTSNLRPSTLTRPRPTSTTPTAGTHWRDEAACGDFYRSKANPDGWDVRAEGGDPFFPEGHSAKAREELARVARAVCAACPVAAMCDQSRAEKPKTEGIWSGREWERVNAAPRATIRPVPAPVVRKPRARLTESEYKHGTYGSYTSHLRRGTEPCEPCKEAMRAKERRRRAKKIAEREAAPIVHGTADGWRAHVRRDDRDCTPCSVAYQEERRARRVARRQASREVAA